MGCVFTSTYDFHIRLIRYCFDIRRDHRPCTIFTTTLRQGWTTIVDSLMGHLHVYRQCWPAVLWLWLGDDGSGDWVFVNRSIHFPISVVLLSLPVVYLPCDIRRWAYQDPRRPMLARPNVHGVPLRNTAKSRTAKLVLSQSTSGFSQSRNSY